eukprot:gene26313-32878_t
MNSNDPSSPDGPLSAAPVLIEREIITEKSIEKLLESNPTTPATTPKKSHLDSSPPPSPSQSTEDVPDVTDINGSILRPNSVYNTASNDLLDDSGGVPITVVESGSGDSESDDDREKVQSSLDTLNTADRVPSPIIPETVKENEVSVSVATSEVVGSVAGVVVEEVKADERQDSVDRIKLRVVEIQKRKELVREQSLQQQMELGCGDLSAVSEGQDLDIEIIPFAVLVTRNANKQFDGLVLGELERHLSDEEFKKHFEVATKDARSA